MVTERTTFAMNERLSQGSVPFAISMPSGEPSQSESANSGSVPWIQSSSASESPSPSVSADSAPGWNSSAPMSGMAPRSCPSMSNGAYSDGTPAPRAGEPPDMWPKEDTPAFVTISPSVTSASYSSAEGTMQFSIVTSYDTPFSRGARAKAFVNETSKRQLTISSGIGSGAPPKFWAVDSYWMPYPIPVSFRGKFTNVQFSTLIGGLSTA